MKAILVRYFGATNYRGSYMKATAEGVNPVKVPFHSADDPALEAAIRMVKRQKWAPVILHGGSLPNGDRVFTMQCNPYAIQSNDNETA